MQTYSNRGGNSGVVGFEIFDDGSLLVEFHDAARYLYTEESTGAGDLAAMRRLARAGQGLNGYINRHVRERYARRLRPDRSWSAEDAIELSAQPGA